MSSSIPSVRVRVSLLALCLFAAVALPARLTAQTAAAPATPQPAAAPTADTTTPSPPSAVADSPSTAPAVQSLRARVLEVKGDVQHAPIGSSEWKPCKADEEYPEQTKIRTGVRSAIKLQLGSDEPYTAVLIESVGLVALAELARTPESKRVRIGVGYGKIRAGVAEGGLQSDFTVDSPVATLSKRGTWNFGLSFDRGTERFEVFLAEHGLVEALRSATSERRTLQPGQAVTQAMRRWLDEVELRQNVPIADLFGQEDMIVAFNRIDNDGLGVLGPGSGRTLFVNLGNDAARGQFQQQLRTALRDFDGAAPPPDDSPILRPEGFFGTGRGEQLIPLLLDPSSALVKSGAARSGRYWIRRSAMHDYLRGGGPR
ncbi:MAG: hypothetical protein HRU75_14245 [Planctomycetia bacterium]|nr:MAG: hypothetical protein HRU75_14245 [Planctomycetia bacterium]